MQIDPEGKLAEVHESRLNSSGDIVDAGGNNDGYFDFIITSPEDAMRRRNLNVSAAEVRTASAPSDGILFRSIYPGKRNTTSAESMRAALEIGDMSDTIRVDLNMEGRETDEDNITFYMLLGMIAEGLGISEDASIPITCSLTYDGDEYYPEAYLSGVNFKPGAAENMSADEDIQIEDIMGDTFLVHRIALVPHTTTKFVIHLTPRKIDWRNGAMFIIKVPELVAPAMIDDDEETNTGDTDTDTETPSGGDDLPANDPGPSDGGCEAVTGSLSILVLAGLALVSKKKRQ